MPSTTFKETTKGSGAFTNYYFWTLAANWTSGVPMGRYDVSATATDGGLQDDDIASLTLNSLSLTTTATAQEVLHVTGSLSLRALSLNGGSTNVFLIADFTLAGAPATITVSGAISVTGTGILEASGDGASVFVDVADPGGMQYWAAGPSGPTGGFVYLQNAPSASSLFKFNGTGTFAFANPGSVISSSLTNAQAGDSIELPANQVLSVSYGASSLAVRTDAGVYNFANVGFTGVAPNDFSASMDFATGLEKITFLSAPVFQGGFATSGVYESYFQWSRGLNWSTNAVPASGADVVLGSATQDVLVDDLPVANVGRLIFGSSESTLAVNGALAIGTLQFGASAPNQLRTLLASTLIPGGATSATITINSMVNADGGDGFSSVEIQAAGIGASVVVNGSDAGEFYRAFSGGRIIMNVAPRFFGSGIEIDSGGTLVLTAPGTSVAGVTTVSLAMGVVSGGSVEVPGSMLSMSNSVGGVETIVTDDGTYVFGGWYSTFGGANFGISDFIATRDGSSGLIKLTAETPGAADNPQHNNDVNGDGFADIIFQNVSGQTAAWEINDFSIIGSSFLPNPGGTWALVATGDFTGDGKSDLLFQDVNGAIAEWLMNGDSVAAGVLPPNPGPTWKVDATGDFTRDGRSDIALQQNDGSVAIWEMNGANIIANGAAVVAQPGTAWKPVTSGDFWNDGKTELVLQNTDGSLAFWGFNDSASGPVLDMTHTALLALNPGAAWVLKGTGDVNGDGISDLAFQNSSTGQAAIWEMNQTGLLNATSFTTFTGPGANWAVVQVGDFNGDGMSDILFQNTATGQLDIVTVNGLSPISTATFAANPGTSWHVIG